MRTARLPNGVSVATNTYQWWLGAGVGPQVNKFEQVSTDDHQMSLAAWIGYVQGEGVGYVWEWGIP